MSVGKPCCIVSCLRDRSIFIWTEVYYRLMKKYDLPVHEEPYSFLTEEHKRPVLEAGSKLDPEEMSGYSENELVGRHFSKLRVFKLGEMPRYMKQFASVLKGEVAGPLKLSFQRKNGMIVHPFLGY